MQPRKNERSKAFSRALAELTKSDAAILVRFLKNEPGHRPTYRKHLKGYYRVG